MSLTAWFFNFLSSKFSFPTPPLEKFFQKEKWGVGNFPVSFLGMNKYPLKEDSGKENGSWGVKVDEHPSLTSVKRLEIIGT